MDTDEIKDSVKSYIDTRLRNPYFASVFAVWIVTNRVIVFGLFNFDAKLTLQQRIDWVYQQFQSFKILNFIGLYGFIATII